MWVRKSSSSGALPSHISRAPIAMCPFAFSLARNDVSNDVSLSMWRCAISLLPVSQRQRNAYTPVLISGDGREGAAFALLALSAVLVLGDIARQAPGDDLGD